MSRLDDLLAGLASGDELRAERASDDLAAMGEAVIPSLAGLASAPDVDTRWWVVRTLAALPNLDAERLIPFLSDASAEVRQCAALGLCAHPGEDATRSLVQMLNDADGLAAELASKALAAIGAPAVESLMEVVKTGSQSARIHAMRALSEIADPRSIRTMIEAMGETSVRLHYWAERGLDRLGVNMVYLKP